MKTFLIKFCCFAIFIIFSACSNFLYYPTRQLHFDPKAYGLSPEEIFFRSADGTSLFSWLFHTPKTPARGVFIYYHGNGENISSHYLSMKWILEFGFDLFIFDYRGYGRSQGEPSPQGTVADGEAALRWLFQRYGVKSPIIIFGHSLGGAIALRNAIDLKNEIPYRAVIVHSSFASYQAVGRRIMARSIVSWPFQWLPYLVLGDRYAPGKDISRLSPRPILVIHSEKDAIIPFLCGEELFSYAQNPKDFWRLPIGNHDELFEGSLADQKERLLEWVNKIL